MNRISLLTRFGVASVVLVLGIVGVFSALVFAVRSSHSALEGTRRGDAVIANATELESLALALRASGRGYVISGSPLFLASASSAERE